MPRILVIDDQAFLRDVLRRMLESAGYQVLTARDGEEGLRLFRLHPADLVLCGVFMPEKDGLEVIRELQRDAPGVRVVAISGGSSDGRLDALSFAGQFGAAATLRKPFTPEALLAVVREALEPPPPADAE